MNVSYIPGLSDNNQADLCQDLMSMFEEIYVTVVTGSMYISNDILLYLHVSLYVHQNIYYSR